MQTAAAEKEQVVQGIEAGVYYYLTKPYDKNVMLSIVRSAIKDYDQYRKLLGNLDRFRSKIYLIRDSHFEIHTLDDAEYLSTFVSQFFPDPARVVLGVSELLTNAIEHGNLGITYEEKSALNREGKWLSEIERRLAMPENQEKKALVSYVRSKENIVLTIKDEGNGFDWEKYLYITPDRATDSHGRGIAISRMLSFDSMEYTGNGNEVVCTILLH
jgi:anti-sigma regulatory factor (Ser/Thr protein kinase)